MRWAEIERIIIQEQGEKFYNEKMNSKTREWMDLVEDESRREQLRMQIEYFQIYTGVVSHEQFFETKLQREEREKTYNKTGYRSNRRIIGYTFNTSLV